MEPAIEQAIKQVNQAGEGLRRAVEKTFPEGARVSWREHFTNRSETHTGRVMAGRTWNQGDVCVLDQSQGKNTTGHVRFLPAAKLTLLKEKT